MEQRLFCFAHLMKSGKIWFERLSLMEWLSVNVAPSQKEGDILLGNWNEKTANLIMMTFACCSASYFFYGSRDTSNYRSLIFFN